MQDDLEKAYTGSQMFAQYIEASVFVQLWSCLLYAPGMPVMYPIACIFFLVLYGVQKFLLTKEYSRSTSFNEDLPLNSIPFMYLGYFYHAAVGLFMFSNTKLLSSVGDDSISSLGSFFFASSSFAQRFNGLHNTIFICFNIIVVAALIIKWFFFEGFIAMLKCCCSKKTVKGCLKSADLHRRDRKFKSNDFYAELSIEWLSQHF